MQNTKYRKQTIQMKYPAPYSQSWLSTEPIQMGIDKMRKYASNRKKQNMEPIRKCCWHRPKPLTQGSNPYAPHLKYGVFPRKVSLCDPENKLPVGRKIFPLENMDKFIKDKRHFYKKERNFTDAPLYAVHPIAIDKQYTRRLSLSEMTHVDIEPHNSLQFPGAMSPRLPHRLRSSRRY